MKKKIRIGTRSSELALWQANTVSGQLNHLGHETEIVKIDSVGDAVLNKPLYDLGTTGVFTKNLDIALLNDQIDIAVHSLKDVPTRLPRGISQIAVLKRGQFHDVLVLKSNDSFFSNKSAIIATGSLRRRAQWLYRYPHHHITGLRGNVNTRLKKLAENDWDGAIFARAGLKRINLLPESAMNLDWMLPAPAQGAVMIAALTDRLDLKEICAELNDRETEICVGVERDFLNKLEGGCSAPIGALATVKDKELKFKGGLFSTDGKQKIEFSKVVSLDHISDLAQYAAQYILDRGGKKLMRIDGMLDKEIKVFSTKHLSIVQRSRVDKHIGFDMSDFITTRYNRLKSAVIKEPIDHVIFTSQNAVSALLDNFEGSALNFKQIYCVGRRTKRLIERKMGKVAHVENSAGKLANYLNKHLDKEEVTFFCGNIRRDELPNQLTENGIDLKEVVCYQTLLTPNSLNDQYQALLFFSPSAIDSFLEKNVPADEVVFCIGSTTADKAKQHFKEVIEARNPSVESVLSSLNEYYSK